MPEPAASFTRPAVAFLGAGSMSGAILAGLVPHRGQFGALAATCRSAASAVAATHEGVETVALEHEPGANRRLAAASDIVVLGVKPAQVVALLEEIRDALRPGAVVVSIAAGIPLATLEAAAPGVAIVRAMPNTPVRVGLGVTGICVGHSASEEQVAAVSHLFDLVGRVVRVDEAGLTAVTAVSGSGPAYVYYFAEEWMRSAIAVGFEPAEAEAIVTATIRGAAEMLATQDADAAELRRRVTSPNGTTERAIAVLEEAGWAATLERAQRANMARAEELARGE